MDECCATVTSSTIEPNTVIEIYDDVKTATIEPDTVIDRKKVEIPDDPVNHPTHYTYGSIECIDFIDSCGYGLDFCIANAIKYLTRCKHKGTCEQDIRKAIWYATHAADGLKNGKYELPEEELKI